MSHTASTARTDHSSFTDPFVINAINGNVSIGTASPSYTLHVNGSVAGVGGYNALSDIRYKYDIKPLTNSLDKILAIRGVSYKWIDEERFGSGTQLGVIAQEIEEIVPEVVTTDREGVKRVRYDDLIPLVIEAIKAERAEKNAEITRLKDQVLKAEKAAAQLKTESTRLNKELDQLKAALCHELNHFVFCAP